MSNQQELVEQLFETALTLEGTERTAFLEEACGGKPELRRLVEELLAEDALAGSFLEHPLLSSDRAAVSHHAASLNTIHFENRNATGSSQLSRGRFEPGEMLIDRFVIVRYIAGGGMGEVYEAEDHFLQDTHIALKIIRPWIANNPNIKSRFEREVMLAQKVTHQNLCPIYDIFHCDYPAPSFLFLTMKLLPGITLAERLSTPPLIPLEDALQITRQIIAGLTAIHTANIIHRDIKPNNIMLYGTGNDLCVWITDFGLARAYETDTTLFSKGAVAGTPDYIAPELFRGQQPSQASDIFALGVVLHEIFTGEKPVINLSNASAITNSRLKSSHLPPYCIHLIVNCLSDDPKCRYQAFEEAKDHFLAEYPHHSPREFWTRRRFITAAAAAAGITAGGAWWQHERLENLLHPLPLKRFVAVLNWPPATDSGAKPMIARVIDAIENKLARVEAADRNLLVITPSDNKDPTTPSQLRETRDSLGANLVLATSGTLHSGKMHLSLQVLDPTSHPLREKQIICPEDQQISLPDKAVAAAAELLNVSRYLNVSPIKTGTQSPDAYAAFQAAEALMKQENDTGLSAAIDKYKLAVELDPRYAIAHARLAIAYLRSYVKTREQAALNIAQGNIETALNLDPDIVEGHLARASILQETGDQTGAQKEFAKALSLDPSNPRTLIYQAQLYARLNRWEDAEKIFGRVLKERPNYWLAYNELGTALSSQGKYMEALKAFRSAALVAPKSAIAFNNIGDISLRLGRIPEAIDNLRKSFELSPSDFAASTMSEALRSQGKHAEALSYAQKAVKLNPSESANWLEVGECYYQLRAQGEAKNAYNHAAQLLEEQLQTDATNGPGWMSLALCRVKSSSPLSAPSLIKKAESNAADDISSQIYKARILELLGKRDEALAAIESCLKKGATKFQMDSAPDLEALRKDPRYPTLSKSHLLVTELSSQP